MRRRGAWFLLLASGAACSSFSASPAGPEGGDAGAADAASDVPSDVAPPSDAGADADADAAAACPTNPIAVPFTSSRWLFRAAAGVSADGGAQLVSGVTNEQGQVWWTEPHVADQFTAHYTVRIGPGGGDGMTFAWIALAVPPSAGGPGGNMGVCSSGNPGWAVALDMDPTPTVKLMSTLTGTGGCPDAPLATGAVSAGVGEHVVKVSLGSAHITVDFDGNTPINYTIPNYVPASSYFGFTAANGTVAAPFTVSSVDISFAVEPLCP